MTRRTAVIAAAAVIAVAGFGIATRRSGPFDPCPRSSLLVPSCGALWGVATDPNTRDAVESVEDRAKARFDLVYRFHDLDDQFPTADERALVVDGRILHFTIAPKIFGSPLLIRWRTIVAGTFDRQLSAQASAIAALDVPVFVTFDHESDRPDRSDRGSPADFVAAWRHVHDLYVRAGADNAVWVWVVTGYPPFFVTAGRIWPGDRYVDWIGWEAYNGSGCTSGKITPAAYTSFGTAALRFFHWVHATGARYGIDAGKPMMISEAGSVVYRASPDRAAQWYAGIPPVLAQYRQIKAVTLWDRPGNGVCDYRFDDAPQVLAAIGRAGVQVHYSQLAAPGSTK
jgi:hypothetical protein